MAETTNISWCDATHNHWIGCTKVSPACDGCYVEHLMDTRLHRVASGGPGRGAGTRALTSEANRRKPLAWNREAERDRTRPFVFCSSLADVFDNQVPTEWRRDLFDLIRSTPRLVWLLLTKRPQLIVSLAEEAGGLPPNAALGTTVEDQERAINLFRLAVAARDLHPLFTFASFEPLLGLVDPTRVHLGTSPAEFRDAPHITKAAFYFDALRGAPSMRLPPLGWVITGGETDQGANKARPTHPQWFRSLRDQCAAAHVPFHLKQWGEWAPVVIDDEDEGYLGPAYPIKGCSPASAHDGRQPCLFWQGDDLVQWPFVETVPAIGARRVGKRAAGRTLDGVIHDARPEVR